MQKKIIALAVVSLMSGAAFAQSSVSVSGSLDAAFTQYTNDQDAGSMLGSGNKNSADKYKAYHGDTTHKTNRIAIKGTDDLGGGLSAFFELEERFSLDTGATADSTKRFSRSSWIGLASANLGKVYLGRTPTAGDMVFGGSMIGNYDTIADWGSRKGDMDDRQANGILYATPKFGPVTMFFSTAVKETNNSAAPMGVSASADLGMFVVEAAYQKDGANDQGPSVKDDTATGVPVADKSGAANEQGNMSKSWFVNGKVKLGANYNAYAYVGKTQGYESYDYTGAPVGKSWMAETLRYAVAFDALIGANGKLAVNLGKAITEKNTDFAADVKYYQLGVSYFHKLSARTSLFGAATYERMGNMAKAAGGYTTRDTSVPQNNRTGFQVGMRHAF